MGKCNFNNKENNDAVLKQEKRKTEEKLKTEQEKCINIEEVMEIKHSTKKSICSTVQVN